MRRRTAPAQRAECRSCTHFRNEPAYLEAVLNGFTGLGSGYAAARAEDGLCVRHDCFAAPWGACADYAPSGAAAPRRAPVRKSTARGAHLFDPIRICWYHRRMAQTIAILGGTGQMGGALALRWARAGLDVILGSRATERAEAAARALRDKVPGAAVRGMETTAAAEAGEIIVLAVPWPAHAATLTAVRPAVQGKILVDVTVPLAPPRVARVALPPEGAAAMAAQALLGADVKVVAAFETVPAHCLADPAAAIDGDVLVCGNDKGAREAVIALARAAGLEALHGGALANAAAAETLAAVQIFLNGRYRGAAAVRFTGLGRRD